MHIETIKKAAKGDLTMDFMVFMAKMFVFFFPGVLTGLGLAHCRNRGQRNRREEEDDE